MPYHMHGRSHEKTFGFSVIVIRPLYRLLVRVKEECDKIFNRFLRVFLPTFENSYTKFCPFSLDLNDTNFYIYIYASTHMVG